MNFTDPVARAQREHDANLAREEDFRKKRADSERRRDAAEDFDTKAALQDEIEAIDRRLTLAAGVTAGSAGRLAQAKTEAEDRARRAENTAMKKRRDAGIKKVHAAIKGLKELLPDLQAVAAEEEAFDKYNAQRGDLPYIESPERAARLIPGRVIPAEYRDATVWEDGAGNRPAIFGHDSNGELVPREAGYTKKTVRVVSRAEQVIPDQMPPELGELIAHIHRVVGR